VAFPDDGKTVALGFVIFLIGCRGCQAVSLTEALKMGADIGIEFLACVKGDAGAAGRALHPAKRAGMDFVMKGDTLGMFNKHCHGLS
jgi:hypothetical protein